MATQRPERFDAIVIGAGQAGPSVARHLVSEGSRVALVEQDKVGGTCLNRGCRPTKAMRASARVAHLARIAATHGVSTGDVTVDFAAVMARKDRLIDHWVDGYTDDLEQLDGLTLVHGQARFTGSGDDGHVVAVDDRSLVAPQVFLNVGTRATEPPIPGARRGGLARQRPDPAPRRGSRSPRHRRRQLHRPRVRADVPPLRQRRHDRRTRAARRRAGGRRHRCRDHSLPHRGRRRHSHWGQRRSGRRRRRGNSRRYGRRADPRVASAARRRAHTEHRSARPRGCRVGAPTSTA